MVHFFGSLFLAIMLSLVINFLMARSLSMTKEVDEKEMITKTKNSFELSGQIFRPVNPLGKVAQKFTDKFK